MSEHDYWKSLAKSYERTINRLTEAIAEQGELMKLPTPDKCFKKTAYPLQKCEGETMTRVWWPTCIYLKNGKCQLNACVKNTKGARS